MILVLCQSFDHRLPGGVATHNTIGFQC